MVDLSIAICKRLPEGIHVIVGDTGDIFQRVPTSNVLTSGKLKPLWVCHSLKNSIHSWMPDFDS